MKISIVIPFFKHPELCDSFFDQLFTHTDFTQYAIEVIAVDDASGMPELTEVLNRWAALQPQLRVIVRAENGGFPGATNSGIRAATGDYVICISSDVNVLDEGWLDALIKPQQSLKCLTGGQYIDFNSLTFVDGVMVPYLGGWCMCFPRAFLTELTNFLGTDQVFEESFKPGYFEDVLVSFYAKYVFGYELVAPSRFYPEMNVHLHHIGGQTLNQQAFPTEIIAERNRLRFCDMVRLACLKRGITL